MIRALCNKKGPFSFFRCLKGPTMINQIGVEKVEGTY